MSKVTIVVSDVIEDGISRVDMHVITRGKIVPGKLSHAQELSDHLIVFIKHFLKRKRVPLSTKARRVAK
jgi:hypothetical protein